MKKKRKKYKIRKFSFLWWAGWISCCAFMIIGSWVIVCGAAAL